MHQTLLAWYRQQGRQLPWRETRDPYAIWISEIMLQQTQVKTVLPYYQRWLQLFPTVYDLAAADQQTVLKAWEGLGYYARARNLHKAAQVIVAQHQGQFPEQFEDVVALPGIGRTTAGGILSAAFNQPVPILDGNVKRVLARLIALRQPPSKALDQLWQLSTALVPPREARDFNQALMDLGATVCTRHRPACLICPWRSPCAAYNQNVQLEIPMTETRAPLPHKQIGVAVVWNEQRQILIDRRPQSGLLGGLWEFPGGKIEPGEAVEDCIRRELQEELAIDVEVGDRLITIDHTYTHFKVTLNVFHCRHIGGKPQPIECDEVRWVAVSDLEQFPFPKANGQIIEAIKEIAVS
ncbi:A/G-specific adenine glycosylase [Leptolyngbya iicbica LK]|uniref:Adenine DNA glycosylase n=2 Tax=Cyanophyceae TaxID=3028117 RepID=A0A4Q7EIV0_9CYAN|nr:A/G-specific adenine glycosylase [Leptolyngbya sp. LK]RZM83018.1 A/G-specific adenine glycosylase [Leptolyngbya sp. LK]